MVGNDIVDLELARVAHRWKDPRFQKKVFCEQERAIITASSNPFTCIWRFWSMKESAYKIHKRVNPTSTFSPIKYTCIPQSQTSGLVIKKGKSYVVQTVLGSSMVYSHSCDKNAETITNQYYILPENHEKRSFVVETILNEIAEHDKLEINELEVRKDNSNIPSIFFNNQRLPVSLSITHHGRYAAIAMVRENIPKDFTIN